MSKLAEVADKMSANANAEPSLPVNAGHNGNGHASDLHLTEPPAETTGEPRAMPKRKFTLHIGNTEVLIRKTTEEVAEMLQAAEGLKAVLEVDGHKFHFLPPSKAHDGNGKGE